MRTPLLSLMVALGAAAAHAQAPGYVWLEAEQPAATNFPARHAFEPANEAEATVLSEGKWIGVEGPRDGALFLEYTFDAPAAGSYQLYARKFWKHGPYRWRVDDGEWTQVTNEVALLDDAPIRKFVNANWTHMGEAQLDAGTHTLRVELTTNDGAAAFDAFLITTQPFTPRGKLKPGTKYGRAAEGWFAFEPDADPFAKDALDLRSLNEPQAGSKGVIAVKDGAFIHSRTGEPVRFWAVNGGGDIARMDRASIDALAKSLAKRGVNLYRYHGTIYEGSGRLENDPKQLDRVHYLVSALKREGIYTDLSIYFPLWVRLDAEHGWAGYDNQIPFALLYFDEKFQEAYRRWWRFILTTPNPYDDEKRPLAADPAVAMCEIINEDSYFFWTFTPYKNVPAPQIHKLERQFAQWLTKKYGSVAKALDAWGNTDVEGDAPREGRVGVAGVWRLFNVRDQRSKDTAAFLTEHQKAFYADTTRYLKETLGYRGTVYASNWTTASAQYLTPLEKYTYTAADFLDRHGYYGGAVEAERNYLVEAGQIYFDRTFLRAENDKGERGKSFGSPIAEPIYAGLPSMISEIDWPTPNRYRTEMPLLSAAYGALQGQDAFVFFSLSGPGWRNTTSKWPIQTPETLGQFPAAALIFRNGLVKTSEPVVQAALNVAELKALGGAPVSSPVNLDDLRAADIPPGQMREAPAHAIDPRSFYVGQVRVDFTDSPATLHSADLSRYIDDSAKTIRSATDEIVWDYGAGLLRIDAPKAQAAVGFLRDAGTVDLGDVAIESPLEYGAVAVVALDDQPLATSRRVLVQVMSEQRNFGYTTRPLGDGRHEITSMGEPPINVRELAGSVTFKSGQGLRATALDANLYPAGEVTVENGRITLRPDVLYYLIER